jgi:hypothetical protein
MSTIITKLDSLDSDIRNPNFSSNYPNEYNYLNQLKNSITTNYDNNAILSQNITSNIENLQGKYGSQIKKLDDISQRKIEISRFYMLKYKKEISILQKIVLICGIGLLGCLLYNIRIISNNFLSLYLGVVLSVGFVMVFYSLWDIYIRDNNVFDEYDYGVYSSKTPTIVTPSNDEAHLNLQLSNLKC